MAARVACCVDSLVFLGKVPDPVLVEVAVADHGAEFENGLGAVEAPAGAGDVEAVLDQMSAGALDDPGGDRPTEGQSGGIVQVGLLVGQVRDGPVDAGRFVVGQVGGVGGEICQDVIGVAGQDLLSLVAHPGFGSRVALWMQAPGRAPQILKDMNQVDK